MMLADLINGAFEFGGAAANFVNVTAIYRAKGYSGVSIFASALFTSWGFWNLYYYPHLNQWASFSGGVAIVAMNTVWVSLALYFGKSKP